MPGLEPPLLRQADDRGAGYEPVIQHSDIDLCSFTDFRTKGFSENKRLCAAASLIDRLMHHCHVVNIRGNSYRMREHADPWHAIQQKANQSGDMPARTSKRKEIKTN